MCMYRSRTWKNISVIQMKKVLEIKHSTPCVLDGVSLKASNQEIVIQKQKNVYVPEQNLELNTPNALMTPSAACGVRLKSGKQPENARESITGIAYVNRPQRTKIMKLNDRITTFVSL